VAPLLIDTADAARVGNLVGWGLNAGGDLGNANATQQPRPVRTRLAPDVVVTDVSSGFLNHSLAVMQYGGILGWGANSYGKLGDGASLPSYTPVAADLSMLDDEEVVTAVSAGEDHSLALTSEGRVLGFGYGATGELGKGFDVSRVVATLPSIRAADHRRRAASVSGGPPPTETPGVLTRQAPVSPLPSGMRFAAAAGYWSSHGRRVQPHDRDGRQVG
jgi:alpha-tubulin suppressor-like RCC1 family protein